MDILLKFILATWLLVDMGSGFLTYYTSFDQLAVIIRGVVLSFLVYYSAFNTRQQHITLLLLLVAMQFQLVLQSLVFSIEILDAARGAAKVLTPIFLLYVTQYAVRNNRLSSLDVHFALWANSLVLLTNIIIAHLGIGFSAYENDKMGSIGGSGFVQASNEMGVGVLVCMTVLLAVASAGKKLWLGLAGSFLGVLGSMAVLTKAALIGAMLLLTRYSIAVNKLLVAVYIAVVGGGILAFSDLIAARIDNIMQRWSFFFEEYGYAVFFLGGAKRHDAIKSVLQQWENSPITLMLGTGWSGVTENNLFDLLQAYGLIGIVLLGVWGSWLWLLVNPFTHKPPALKRYDRMAAFGLAMVYGIAFIAGHVMQSALLAIFFALLISLHQNLRQKATE